MEMNGQQIVPASRQQVWLALNAPIILPRFSGKILIKAVRFGKSQVDYQAQQTILKTNWAHVVTKLTEAQRFQAALFALI